MHRNPGSFGTCIVLAGVVLAACAPRPEADDGAVNDQGPPDGSSPQQVARKCATMRWDTAGASVVQALDAAGTVRVRIYPATQSSKTKLKQLVSRRGRIIAKVQNEGNGAWPTMALSGNQGASCWYVWGDNDDRLRSKFVALDGSAQYVDPLFDIYFHDVDHPADKSEWNKPFPIVQEQSESPFRLAATRPQVLVNTGWTTCLLNGCCRSRQ